ncbi:MAG: L-serine ammonia-lyase, iron-sulfur-dependent, subunit alpha [Bacteroides sp.]|nr:L-serine ammonia-lyase, iron-sulfur-dependent, subunit alpha [Bacteroides sp.]MCM1084744.1 L-serine ammonia-lyase, iron-sulfur-dependent, subunit alpha [Bacteroides sp.]
MLSAKKLNNMYCLLKKEVVPALGCTEPIAVALAVAKAAETLRQVTGKKDLLPEKIKIVTSLNIYKNGMGVGIPGTDMTGLYIASALGAIVGDSQKELEVLSGVKPAHVETAKAFVEKGGVEIEATGKVNKVYAEAVCSVKGHQARAVIEETHQNIVLVEVDGKKVFARKKAKAGEQCEDELYDITMDEIYEFADKQPFSKIEFIIAEGEYNKKLSDYGLRHKSGMGIGATLLDWMKERKLSGTNCLTEYAMALTAAASDARMSGALLPAMSNSGSGNQGITAMVPVFAVAEKTKASREKLARALILSNLTAIHIKHGFGRLSAACGCVVASTGAACGVCYLVGGSCEQVKYAIKNMIGNLTGMVCDGAKLGCALKVASGTSAAMQAAILARRDVFVPGTNGIIEDDVERTIRNIGRIASDAMNEADPVILDIMTHKPAAKKKACVKTSAKKSVAAAKASAKKTSKNKTKK